MNALPYPRGAARSIADARVNGMRPSSAVLIIAGGERVDWEACPTSYVDAGTAYQWDWVRGLNVVVQIVPSTRLGTLLMDIERHDPSQIDVLDQERRVGWLVTRTKPTLQTIRWPRHWAADWLDGGDWHRELNQIKTEAREREILKKQAAAQLSAQLDALEIPWN